MPRRALPSSASRARDRVLHPGHVEGCSPTSLVVPCELEIEALARHAALDVADAGPGVEPEPQGPEGAVIRQPGKPGESESCTEEPAALVEHALLDHVVCPPQNRLRNRQPDGLGGLEVDHQLKLRRLLDGKVGGLGALENLVYVNSGAPE